MSVHQVHSIEFVLQQRSQTARNSKRPVLSAPCLIFAKPVASEKVTIVLDCIQLWVEWSGMQEWRVRILEVSDFSNFATWISELEVDEGLFLECAPKKDGAGCREVEGPACHGVPLCDGAFDGGA